MPEFNDSGNFNARTASMSNLQGAILPFSQYTNAPCNNSASYISGWTLVGKTSIVDTMNGWQKLDRRNLK